MRDQVAGTVRLLVIDDESRVATALCTCLDEEGFDVTLERSAGAGLARAVSEAFDVVILDFVLPDGEGLEVLRTLRRQGVKTRVLVVTSRDTIDDRVAGLNAGADDYVVKPFAVAELVARIRALLRRAPAPQARLRVGDLEIDLVTRDVRRADQRIELTPKEFELLAYLVHRQGEVIPREKIARDVYQQEHSTSVDNVIDVHVARVRKKLDEAGGRPMLQTIRGVGFAVSGGLE